MDEGTGENVNSSKPERWRVEGEALIDFQKKSDTHSGIQEKTQGKQINNATPSPEDLGIERNLLKVGFEVRPSTKID